MLYLVDSNQTVCLFFVFFFYKDLFIVGMIMNSEH